MAIKIQPNQLINLQQLEAQVAGPDGANRLFTISSGFNSGVSAFSNSNQFVQQKETFTILVGPVFTRKQFIKAIGFAAVTTSSTGTQTVPANSQIGVTSVDADWDDESGQVEVRIEVVMGSSGTNNSTTINAVSFQCSILAELE